ncbi:MAG: hypothetical protein CVV44_11130 [Spirochaetae bacterium HGW-Spirochaetae-1]|jgi:hypothetical protein|nr:MAG: hypothetical protein CVV44_11130 [Spirochaetae bacterium HGW-Spirochaetae-1]
MKNLNSPLFKNIFTLGALWNWGVGLIGLVFTDFAIGLFFGAVAVTDNYFALLMFRIVMLAVIIFGIGYFMVSRSLYLNRGLVWLGLLSKMILFFMFTWYFILGMATIFAFLTVAGDLIWSLIFLAFLWQTRDSVDVNIFLG